MLDYGRMVMLADAELRVGESYDFGVKHYYVPS